MFRFLCIAQCKYTTLNYIIICFDDDDDLYVSRSVV